MKLKFKFFWDIDAIWKYKFPNFIVLEGKFNNKLLLCSLLNDDAGLGYEKILKYLERDFVYINRIIDEELDLYEIVTEHWYAEINSQEVLIGWLLGATDDDPGELVETWSFDDFYTIVKSWYGMMQRRNYDEELIIEL